MLLVHYRSQPENTTLPVDQRWRTVEVDPAVFTGLDLTTPQGLVAAIRRINDNQIPNVAPFPHGSVVYLTDTTTANNWTLALTITKNT
jgi:hypothetical protein